MRKQRILAQEIESLDKITGEFTMGNSYLKKITEVNKKDRVRFIEKDSDLSIRCIVPESDGMDLL